MISLGLQALGRSHISFFWRNPRILDFHRSHGFHRDPRSPQPSDSRLPDHRKNKVYTAKFKGNLWKHLLVILGLLLWEICNNRFKSFLELICFEWYNKILICLGERLKLFISMISRLLNSSPSPKTNYFYLWRHRDTEPPRLVQGWESVCWGGTLMLLGEFKKLTEKATN